MGKILYCDRCGDIVEVLYTTFLYGKFVDLCYNCYREFKFETEAINN